jgi:hypothetical protein
MIGSDRLLGELMRITGKYVKITTIGSEIRAYIPDCAFQNKRPIGPPVSVKKDVVMPESLYLAHFLD